jgi:hypothetical protein
MRRLQAMLITPKAFIHGEIKDKVENISAAFDDFNLTVPVK